MKTSHWIALALGGLIGVGIAGAAYAPASLADAALRRATAGRVALAETTGTVWRGGGRVVLIDVARSTPDTSGAVQRVLAGVAIPGRVVWELRALPLLVGVVDASLRLDGMAEPMRLAGSPGEIRISAGQFSLPAVELGQLGSPWNTFKPVAALALRWEGAAFRETGFDGRVQIELRDVGSALSPVRPLGSYRIELVGQGRQAVVSVATLSGPLQIKGAGSWDSGGGLRMRVVARAEPGHEEKIRSFLSLLGKRDGDDTVITIGRDTGA